MSDSFSYAMGITQMVIISVGFLGNIASFIIFSRRTFRKNSISTYCQALAIFESLTLIELLNYVALLFYDSSLAATSDALCKILNYIPSLYSSIPAWILVAFSLDKMLSMRTTSTPILKKKWFQWSVVCVIVLSHLLLYIAVPIMLQRIEFFPGYYVCNIAFLNFFNAFVIITLVETCYIPFIVMLVLSILTIRQLMKSRNSVERTAGHVNKDRRSRDARYAISSITFNFMFITFKLPIMVFFILIAYTTIYNVYFYNVAIVLFFFNSSSGFFIHLASNSLFRREIMILLGLNQSESNSRVLSNTTGNSNRVNPVSSTF